jgi:hypothetical protein
VAQAIAASIAARHLLWRRQTEGASITVEYPDGQRTVLSDLQPPDQPHERP